MTKNLNDYTDQGFVVYVMDTETTGLDAEKNDVIEISMCRFSMANFKERDQKTWYLKALNPSTIEDEALRINKHKREDIVHMTKAGREKYQEPSRVVVDIEKWVMEDDVSAIDRVVVGQNINFDIRALKALWNKVDSSNTFPFATEKGNRIVDTKQLAIAIDLCTGKRRRFYNLGTLVKSFGVKKRKAHRAEDDVMMTTDLLIKMLEPITGVASDSFANCYTDLDQ